MGLGSPSRSSETFRVYIGTLSTPSRGGTQQGINGSDDVFTWNSISTPPWSGRLRHGPGLRLSPGAGRQVGSGAGKGAADWPEGVSSRNSEVIHGGLYYPTGSLKRLSSACAAGMAARDPFLDAHGVAYDKCGKIVVATNEAEIARVEAGGQAGFSEIERVRGLQLAVGRAGARARAPEARAPDGAAVARDRHLRTTHGLGMLALEGEIEARAGAVVAGASFSEGAAGNPCSGGGFKVRDRGRRSGRADRAPAGANAAALGAQAAASRRIAGYPSVRRSRRCNYGKGVYFALKGKGAVPHAGLSAADHGRARRALQARYGRTGPLRARPAVRRHPGGYDVDPSRAAAFYDYIQATSGRVCRTGRSAPTTPASGPSCTAPENPNRISASTVPSGNGLGRSDQPVRYRELGPRPPRSASARRSPACFRTLAASARSRRVSRGGARMAHETFQRPGRKAQRPHPDAALRHRPADGAELEAVELALPARRADDTADEELKAVILHNAHEEIEHCLHGARMAAAATTGRSRRAPARIPVPGRA